MNASAKYTGYVDISSARTAVEHAHKAGQLLIEAKKDVSHGQWGEWVKINCQFSERTARKYMQLSKRPLEADLGINVALESMAEPKTLQDLKDEITKLTREYKSLDEPTKEDDHKVVILAARNIAIKGCQMLVYLQKAEQQGMLTAGLRPCDITLNSIMSRDELADEVDIKIGF